MCWLSMTLNLLPAVRWKLENLAKLPAGQREQQAHELERVLSGGVAEH